MHRFVLILAIFAGLASCSDDSSENNTDSPDAADVGEMDASEAPDDSGTQPDDASSVDSGSDAGAVGDMSADASPDMAADTGMIDMSLPDAATGDGCAPGTTRTVGVDGVIVACSRPAETVNQCDAGTLCGAGWHLCTGSEYRAQYESTEPPAVADGTFWIASCIRDGAAPQAPTDQVCSDCTGQAMGAEEDVAFSCVNAIRISSEQRYVGVRAGAACAFVGNTDAGNDAFWSAQPSSTLQSGAFCCPD